MKRVGPDDRIGYIQIDVVGGYDRWASNYDTIPNPLIAIEEGPVLEMVGDVQGLRVLDLGCGTGRYSQLLSEQGAEVIAIDISSVMVEQARQKNKKTSFDLIRGSLYDICLVSSSFDLVVCALTLNHIECLDRMLSETTRVLKKGGTIIISDFHPYWVVFGHGYTEFDDESGQEYRIESFPHLFEDYWRAFKKFGLQVEDLREPRIARDLIVDFPNLEGYQDIPLALVMKLLFLGCNVG